MSTENESETKEKSKLIQGRIIYISEDGWGHIISKEIPFEKIFFHWTALRNDTARFKDIDEGMTVEFVPTNIPGKGWRALNIRIIDAIPSGQS